MAKGGSRSTVVFKKHGARGGINPGGGANVGRKPANQIATSGQTGAQPVETAKAMGKGRRRTIGYGDH